MSDQHQSKNKKGKKTITLCPEANIKKIASSRNQSSDLQRKSGHLLKYSENL